MTTTEKSLKRRIKHRSHRMHPNSLKALIPTQYPPGVSGNNGGNGYSLKAELKHALDKQKRLELINSTIAGAIQLVPVAFHEVWDRVEGKVPGDQPPVTNVNVVFVIGKGYRDIPQLAEGDK